MSHAVPVLSVAVEGLFMAVPLQRHCLILVHSIIANDTNVTNVNPADVRGHVCLLHAAAGMHLSAQLLSVASHWVFAPYTLYCQKCPNACHFLITIDRKALVHAAAGMLV